VLTALSAIIALASPEETEENRDELRLFDNRVHRNMSLVVPLHQSAYGCSVKNSVTSFSGHSITFTKISLQNFCDSDFIDDF
jgi:hypothetical protein